MEHRFSLPKRAEDRRASVHVDQSRCCVTTPGNQTEGSKGARNHLISTFIYVLPGLSKFLVTKSSMALADVRQRRKSFLKQPLEEQRFPFPQVYYHCGPSATHECCSYIEIDNLIPRNFVSAFITASDTCSAQVYRQG